MNETKILYPKPLETVTILERPNRFVARVLLPTGEEVRAHVPVGGRIGGLVLDGLKGLVSGPYQGRATTYTLEAIDLGYQWLGIHQGAVNSYVGTWLRRGFLPALGTKEQVLGLQPEKPLHHRRLDFYWSDPKPTWLEVKTPLIKLHCQLPAGALVREYKSTQISNRMPGQMSELNQRLQLGERVILLACFLYENSVNSEKELQLKDNLDLEGLIGTGRALGLETWSLTAKVTPEAVELKSYQRLK